MDSRRGPGRAYKHRNQKSTNLPFNWGGGDADSKANSKIKSYYKPQKR